MRRNVLVKACPMTSLVLCVFFASLTNYALGHFEDTNRYLLRPSGSLAREAPSPEPPADPPLPKRSSLLQPLKPQEDDGKQNEAPEMVSGQGTGRPANGGLGIGLKPVNVGTGGKVPIETSPTGSMTVDRPNGLLSPNLKPLQGNSGTPAGTLESSKGTSSSLDSSGIEPRPTGNEGRPDDSDNHSHANTPLSHEGDSEAHAPVDVTGSNAEANNQISDADASHQQPSPTGGFSTAGSATVSHAEGSDRDPLNPNDINYQEASLTVGDKGGSSLTASFTSQKEHLDNGQAQSVHEPSFYPEKLEDKGSNSNSIEEKDSQENVRLSLQLLIFGLLCYFTV